MSLAFLSFLVLHDSDILFSTTLPQAETLTKHICPRHSAFLSTLRTNIHLSNASSTPTPMATPPPSPLPPSLPSSLPTLTTHPTTTNAQKVAALRLIADSVAQQRQAASRALITHPLPLSFAFLVLALLAQYVSFPIMMTTSAGIVMSLLVAVRGATGGYLVAAEQIGWKWLEDGSAGDDDAAKWKARGGDETIVLVTAWGEEIIGALAMRVLKKEKRALVRAWTVGLKYRGKGVGKNLLEEGVRLAMTERGCRGVEFEDGHASECESFSIRIIGPVRNALSYRRTKPPPPSSTSRSHISSSLTLAPPPFPIYRFEARLAHLLQPRLRPSRPQSTGHARRHGGRSQSGEELNGSPKRRLKDRMIRDIGVDRGTKRTRRRTDLRRFNLYTYLSFLTGRFIPSHDFIG